MRRDAPAAMAVWMFLIRGILKLLALPLVWAGRLCAMLHLPADAELLKAAWAVSGDGQTGRMALAHIRARMGLSLARAQADLWTQRRPRPEITAYAGLLALEQADPASARAYFERGRELGGDPAGMGELLEFMLAAHDDDPDAMRAVARRLALRRDLSPTVSKLVHTELMWDAMLAGRLDEARATAGRLLAVADQASAEVALWAIARHDRNAYAAEIHLRRAAKLPPDQRAYYMALGAASIGQADEAREILAALRERNERLARNAEWLLSGAPSAPPDGGDAP